MTPKQWQYGHWKARDATEGAKTTHYEFTAHMAHDFCIPRIAVVERLDS